MRKKFFTPLIFLLLFSYLPLQSMAWGMLGHRIVGEIASVYLTDKARSEIKKILRNETIAMASNWADFIRSDSSYRYLNRWHYVDFEKGLTYPQLQEQLKKDTTTNAYTRLNFLIRELKKKNLPKDKKLFYLKLLIHIVGDLSQPLHVSAQGTSGGNSIKVTWFSAQSNLHRVWDENLIEYQQLSYTEYVKAINFPTPSQLKTWLGQPINQWIFESYTISQKLVDGMEQNARLGYEYNFAQVATLNEQLLKGGIRLASVLNNIFK